jgi:hypothetical protein
MCAGASVPWSDNSGRLDYTRIWAGQRGTQHLAIGVCRHPDPVSRVAAQTRARNGGRTIAGANHL